jgi:Family of unknown function (DUF5684)
MGQPQYDNIDSSTFMSVFIPLMIVALVFGIFTLVVTWRVFTKAGKPGWAAIVPFYGTYVLLKIVGRPGWWLILFFVPIVNIVILILVLIDLAHAFGRSGGFAVLLILLQPIGMAILAFSHTAVYVGPVADPNFIAWRNQQYQHPGYPPQQAGPWQ